jgi:hypothetical protein
MSTPEFPQQEQLAVSKFKVTRNAKGDPQWEITVTPDATSEKLDEMREQAVTQYKALARDLA